MEKKSAIGLTLVISVIAIRIISRTAIFELASNTTILAGTLVFFAAILLFLWTLILPASQHEKFFTGAFFLRSALGATWIVALCLLLFPCSFEMNDDVALSKWIAAGFDVPFISIVLGRFLGLLYRHISATVPWYGLFLYCCHVVALALIIFGLLQFKLSRKNNSIFLAVFLSIYMYMLIKVTFTSTAIMLGGAALFLFFSILFCKEKNSTPWLIIAGMVLGITYLIRVNSFVGLLLFSWPLFLYCLRKYYRVILLFFLPVIVIVVFEKCLYHFTVSDAFKDFQTFNKLRGKIHEFPIADANVDNDVLFEANGWSTNDYLLFIHWFFPSEEKYNSETLENVFKLSQPYTPAAISAKIESFLKSGHRLGLYFWKFWLLILIWGLLLWFSDRKAKHRFFLALFYFNAFGILVMINYTMRFPNRIAYPFFLFIFLSGIVFYKYIKKPKIINTVLVIASALFVIYYIYDTQDILIKTKYLSIRDQKIIHQLQNVDEKPVFYILPTSLPGSIRKPLTIYHDPYVNLGSGWSTFSPYYYHKLNSVGLESAHDIVPWMIDKTNAFFVCKSIDRFHIIEYTLDTYGITCERELVKEIYLNRNAMILVFRLKSVRDKN